MYAFFKFHITKFHLGKKAAEAGLFYIDFQGNQQNLTYGYTVDAKKPKAYRETGIGVIGLKGYHVSTKSDQGMKNCVTLYKYIPKLTRYTDINWKSIKTQRINKPLLINNPKPDVGIEYIGFPIENEDIYNTIETKDEYTQSKEQILALSEKLKMDQNNVELWLEYMRQQKSLTELAFEKSVNSKNNNSTISVEISICEEALEYNPDSLILQKKYASLCSKILGPSEMLNKWDQLLEKSWHPSLEMYRLDYLQGSFLIFSATDMVKEFNLVLEKLEKYRKNYSNYTRIIDLTRIHILLRMISFYIEAGYVEKGVALLIAYLEWTFFLPKSLTGCTKVTKLQYFSEYWENSTRKINDESSSNWEEYYLGGDGNAISSSILDQSFSKLDTNAEITDTNNTKNKLLENAEPENIQGQNNSDISDKVTNWINNENENTSKYTNPVLNIKHMKNSKIFLNDTNNPAFDPFRCVIFDDITIGLFDEDIPCSDLENIQLISTLMRLLGVSLPSVNPSTIFLNSEINENLNPNNQNQNEKHYYDFGFSSDPFLDTIGGIWHLPDEEISLKSSENNEKYFSEINEKSTTSTRNCPILKSFLSFFARKTNTREENETNLYLPFVANLIEIDPPRKSNRFLDLSTKLSNSVKEWLNLCYIFLEKHNSYRSGKNASKKYLKKNPESWIIWDMYANIELSYGKKEQAVKVWNGALERLALLPKKGQSFSVIIWLNMIMYYIGVKNVKMVKRCLVMMNFPESWKDMFDGNYDYSRYSHYFDKICDTMSGKYIDWDSSINPSEWFSGLVASSLFSYYFSSHQGNENLDDFEMVNLILAEKKLLDASKGLINIISTIESKREGKKDQEILLNAYTLNELILVQIASLHLFHNNTTKAGFQPKLLKQSIEKSVLMFPRNTCFWDLVVKSETSININKTIDLYSKKTLCGIDDHEKDFIIMNNILYAQRQYYIKNSDQADILSLRKRYNTVLEDCSTSKSIKLWLVYILIELAYTRNRMKEIFSIKGKPQGNKLKNTINEAIRQLPWSKGVLMAVLSIAVSGLKAVEYKEIFGLLIEKDFRLWSITEDLII
ncbi:hypothetical protein BB559_003116 [Furculomyces boomerangus]|uniref:DUF1740-domain-containing protein n=1 Tax=Furculomyces boomerangus TaxID=61424 RepID=A0A2T9YNQ1_9FUNG|nr:hypothetical protein BB559_003116 [Furculomyces boomerangus]